MIVQQKDMLAQGLTRLKDLKQRATDELREDFLYHAYLTVFRDLGIELREAPLSEEFDGLLLVSPIRATAIVRESASREQKVFHCAHALGHLLRNHGQGRQWFILRDYHDETKASAEEREKNNEAGIFADALLTGIDAPSAMKIQAFRELLRRGVNKQFIRETLRRLQHLHHMTQAKWPLLNGALKRIPLAVVVCHSVRSILAEWERNRPNALEGQLRR